MSHPASPAAQARPEAQSQVPPAPNAHTASKGAVIAALGVVFGDIGTSPLYAMRECLHGAHGVAPTPANVLGVLSLVFWALIIVVTIKYVVYVLRADNQGEGGILALMALASQGTASDKGRHGVAILLGLFGSALLYGDGMITPAISVLSAVEGLEVAAPALHPYVIPLTVVILIGLFWMQSRGTARIGAIFGPVTLAWFVLLAVLGLMHLVQTPAALAALDPRHGLRFLASGGHSTLLAMGSVFLVVTGGEALYADMGHFGASPIRRGWFSLVFPALMLNYLGQGALLLRDPSAASNPFYRMVPELVLYPTIALATCATVIASQALITGAFSLTRQAIMLGYCPRLRIVHTSHKEIGQIYVPFVNWTLMLATLWLVLELRTSSKLASAYGVAVSFTMVITSLLTYVVAQRKFGWSQPAALAATVLMLIPELAFLGANSLKIPHGGWFPLAIGAVVMLGFTTWQSGRKLLGAAYATQIVPLDDFLARVQDEHAPRVPGTAVYMTTASGGVPPALWQMFQHNHVIHERIVLFTVITEEIARVPRSRRIEVMEIAPGVYRVIAHYGFVEHINVPLLLERAHIPGHDGKHVTYFLGRETVIPTPSQGMALWREKLFAFMARNAYTPTSLFRLPPDRVVEVGAQIRI